MKAMTNYDKNCDLQTDIKHEPVIAPDWETGEWPFKSDPEYLKRLRQKQAILQNGLRQLVASVVTKKLTRQLNVRYDWWSDEYDKGEAGIVVVVRDFQTGDAIREALKSHRWLHEHAFELGIEISVVVEPGFRPFHERGERL